MSSQEAATSNGNSVTKDAKPFSIIRLSLDPTQTQGDHTDDEEEYAPRLFVAYEDHTSGFYKALKVAKLVEVAESKLKKVSIGYLNTVDEPKSSQELFRYVDSSEYRVMLADKSTSPIVMGKFHFSVHNHFETEKYHIFMGNSLEPEIFDRNPVEFDLEKTVVPDQVFKVKLKSKCLSESCTGATSIKFGADCSNDQFYFITAGYKLAHVDLSVQPFLEEEKFDNLSDLVCDDEGNAVALSKDGTLHSTDGFTHKLEEQGFDRSKMRYSIIKKTSYFYLITGMLKEEAVIQNNWIFSISRSKKYWQAERLFFLQVPRPAEFSLKGWVQLSVMKHHRLEFIIAGGASSIDLLLIKPSKTKGTLHYISSLTREKISDLIIVQPLQSGAIIIGGSSFMTELELVL